MPLFKSLATTQRSIFSINAQTHYPTSFLCHTNLTHLYQHNISLISDTSLTPLLLSFSRQMDSAAATKVEEVTKKSSEELLRKFAELGNDEAGANKELRVSKRRKRSTSRRRAVREGDSCESPWHYSTALMEKKSLLPPLTRKSVSLKQLGIGRSNLRASNVRIFRTIEKTWSKTLARASRVILEKHYNRHKRLINDLA